VLLVVCLLLCSSEGGGGGEKEKGERRKMGDKGHQMAGLSNSRTDDVDQESKKA
jgi:hypothetical protein